MLNIATYVVGLIGAMCAINIIVLLALYNQTMRHTKLHLEGLLSTMVVLAAVGLRQAVTVLRLTGTWDANVAEAAILIPSFVHIFGLGWMLHIALRYLSKDGG